MEERILVHRDESEIKKGKSYFEAVKIAIQKLADFLIEKEIEPSLTLLTGLIKNNSTSKYVFEEKERIALKDIPKLLHSSVNLGTKENITACDELIERAYALLTKSCNCRFIDFDKWDIVDNKVIYTEDAIKELVNEHSIYIDTLQRKSIYDKAMAAKKAIENLNQAISLAPTRGLAEGFKLIGVAPVNASFIFGVLSIDYEGSVELISENFHHIK